VITHNTTVQRSTLNVHPQPQLTLMIGLIFSSSSSHCESLPTTTAFAAPRPILVSYYHLIRPNTISDPHVVMSAPAAFLNSNPSSLVSTGPGAPVMNTVHPLRLTPVSNHLGLDHCSERPLAASVRCNSCHLDLPRNGIICPPCTTNTMTNPRRP
jgi:hypothetical protein